MFVVRDLKWLIDDDCLGAWCFYHLPSHNPTYQLQQWYPKLEFEDEPQASYCDFYDGIAGVMSVLCDYRVNVILQSTVRGKFDFCVQFHCIGRAHTLKKYFPNSTLLNSLKDERDMIGLLPYSTAGIAKYVMTQKIDLDKQITHYFSLDEKGFIREIFYNTQDCIRLLDKSRNWLQFLHTFGIEDQYDIKSCQYPPHPFMLPNASKIFDDGFDDIRQDCAWRWKDVSLLYYIGPKSRELLHQHNVYTLDHPKLFDVLPTGPQTPIQKVMLNHMFEPVQRKELLFRDDLSISKYIYFDIETTVNTPLDPSCPGKTIVNLVGLVYQNRSTFNWEYCEWHSPEDGYCVEEAKAWMKIHTPNHTVVHYTSADLLGIPNDMAKLDLYEQVKDEYLTNLEIQALNLHNFKLKHIYAQLCQCVGKRNLYDSCNIKNGLQAMKALEKWSQEPLANKHLLVDVIKYNRVDCLALLMLHQYLTNIWDWETLNVLN